MKKISRLFLRLMGAAALAAAFSVSCSEITPFTIDAPEDLQDRIDAIAAERNVERGDTTSITILATTVGAEDNSSGWWTEFSDYFTIPSDKLLHLEFVNHGSGENNWNNWNLCVANGKRDADNYGEYFVIRSDAYGWGGTLTTYDAGLLKIDCPDLDEDGDIWNDFRTIMQGATVEMDIDHSKTGNVFVTATSTSADGQYKIVETYQQPVSATDDLVAFLVCDGSWFKMVDAYLIPSKVGEVKDENAASITVSDVPTVLELGDEDYWKGGVATVTFEDGSSKVVDPEDVTFVVPDLTTVGTKTIVYSYSKTKQGSYGPSVAGSYVLEVTNPIVSISAHATAYLIGPAKFMTLSPEAISIEATYSDDSVAPLSSSLCTVAFTGDKVVYEGVSGNYPGAFTVTYTSASGNVIETTGDLDIVTEYDEEQVAPVGASDFTNAWWTTFSRDWNVAPGTSRTVSMKVSSLAEVNWQSPCTILRKSGGAEYAVVRMDNYGWGDSYATAVVASNWNWDNFLSALSGSTVAITVANDGLGMASIRYYVIDALGEEHFQYYDKIVVDSGDVNFAIVTEESYLEFDALGDADPIKDITATATAYLVGGAKQLTLSPVGVKVVATYVDDSQYVLNPLAYSVKYPNDNPFIEVAGAGTYENAFTVEVPVADSDPKVVQGTLVVEVLSDEAQTEPVGAPDFTNGWWTTFSRDWNVPDGTSKTISMALSSDNLEVFHAPCTILRKTDKSEYAVYRMDNYGWGDSYSNESASSNWNWDIFKSSLDGSKVTITVANNDGFASVRYNVVYQGGETHFQYYDIIPVESDDLNFAIVTEESYLVFD